MSKRPLAIILMLALLLLSSGALADVLFDGSVVAGETLTVTAPFGGTVKSLSLRQGAWVNIGDTVATLASTKVYAALDGTVRGIFAQEGDSAEDTVLYIAPVNKYTITANITKAYSSTATKFVNIGETVYISCTSDGSHQAEGIIIAVNGSQYTVETTKGELYMEENVYIYRSPQYETTSRIGRGTASRISEVAVQGTGSLIKLYVADGEEVERGQLLFETVGGTLNANSQPSSQIVSDISGAIASINVTAGATVSKGDVLFTLYPRSSYQIAFTVPESSLNSLAEGDNVTIFFYQDDANPKQYEGTLVSLAYVNNQVEESGGEASYTAYATFEADQFVRLGMSATVTLSD